MDGVVVSSGSSVSVAECVGEDVAAASDWVLQIGHMGRKRNTSSV